MNDCIQCKDELRCLSDDVLIDLTEEELDKYLKCDENVFKPNKVERQQTNTQRVRVPITTKREYKAT
jgi:fructose-1-phosphate kinase PfkB-like protein